ncbi:MAG: 50S ribosomal protein L10 [Oscillospiraceae bacterium]|nr:50S ribosomal protein L10 [Oscillospiraceae bacterium]
MASEKVLQAKQAKVDALTEQLKNAAACVLVDYKGINVEDDTKLRKELREAGVQYSVQKNTLIRLAMHNIGYDQFDGVLEGTTAIAISDGDQTAAARILGEYAEKAQKAGGSFALKAGFVDGEVYDEAGIKALSKIPSKDVLLAQLVGALQGPIQKLAATLQALVDKKNEEAA